MELKQTGYGVKIALAAILAVLVVGYEVFVALRLITAGHFPALWTFETLGIAVSALFLLLVTVAICSNVWTLMARQRQGQALAARDPSVVVQAVPQPDPILALPAGETLALTHR